MIFLHICYNIYSSRPNFGPVYHSFNCLLSPNFCHHFIIYVHISKIWTGDIRKIWIPTTVQILPAPAVQMLSSPRKFVNNRILRHEDLCRKADINKVDKTTCLTVAMFKTKIQNQFTLKGPNQIKCDYTINSAIRPLQIWLTGWRFP